MGFSVSEALKSYVLVEGYWHRCKEGLNPRSSLGKLRAFLWVVMHTEGEIARGGISVDK